jgi:hypothetical protein
MVSDIPEWSLTLIADFPSACAGPAWSPLNKNNIRDCPSAANSNSIKAIGLLVLVSKTELRDAD